MFSFTLPPSSPVWGCVISPTTLVTHWRPPSSLSLFKVCILASLLHNSRFLPSASLHTPLLAKALLTPTPRPPKPTTTTTLTLCNSCNQYIDPVTKPFYRRHHCVCHHPYFSPIQKHQLDYCFINHHLGFYRCPYLTHNLLYHPPYPLRLPQVAIECLLVTFILCDYSSKV